ncbi:MAG: OmpA family protein [Puia sp.]|nr:OmpA family protein [Puia sp.]
MKKVMICLAGSILVAMGNLEAQDSVRVAQDSSKIQADTTGHVSGATIVRLQDSTVKPVDTVKQDTIKPVQDAPKEKEPAKTASEDSRAAGADNRDWDRRWYISPVLKFQLQDFALLEKNRKGYLSDANTLPFQGKGNMSFAASVYKNITGRLAFSADLGFSYGHVTSSDVLISQTKTKTFNLLNAAIYYHLLSAQYRLQPFITIGINDLTNDKSYTSAPIGLGVKYNARSRKVMMMGSVAYGYALSKSIAPTMIYNLGVYLPINNKKKKKSSQDDANGDQANKDDAKKKDTKNDSTASKNGVTNNIYITINLDSVAKARGYKKADDDDDQAGGNRRRRGGQNGDDMAGDEEKLSKFDMQDFESGDFKRDTVDGRPVIKFVVYFEFNEYAMTTRAFSTIDRIIGQLRKNPALVAEVKGYTDNVGTAEYNNFLSRKRAQSVFDYLNSKGIPSDKMSSQYFGKDNPVADNDNPNTAWLNRRAEIIVHVKDK